MSGDQPQNLKKKTQTILSGDSICVQNRQSENIIMSRAIKFNTAKLTIGVFLCDNLKDFHKSDEACVILNMM